MAQLDIEAGKAMLNIVGFAAACFTVLVLLPRLLHTYKTKKDGGVSWRCHWVLLVGLLAWLVYGIIALDAGIALANLAAGGELVLLMHWKSRYG